MRRSYIAVRSLLVAALLTAGAGPLLPQDATIVVPGDRVRLQVAAGAGVLRPGAYVGTVERVGRDTIWLVPEQRDSATAVAWRWLRALDLSTGYLERGQSARRGAAIGGGVGLLVAAIQYAAGGGDCRNLRDPQCFLTARGMAWVVAGGAIGGALGAAAGGEQWKRVYPLEVAFGAEARRAHCAGAVLSIRLRRSFRASR